MQTKAVVVNNITVIWYELNLEFIIKFGHKCCADRWNSCKQIETIFCVITTHLTSLALKHTERQTTIYIRLLLLRTNTGIQRHFVADCFVIFAVRCHRTISRQISHLKCELFQTKQSDIALFMAPSTMRRASYSFIGNKFENKSDKFECVDFLSKFVVFFLWIMELFASRHTTKPST